MTTIFFRRRKCVSLAILVPHRFITRLFIVLYRTLCLLLTFAARRHACQSGSFRRCAVRSVISLSVGVNVIQDRSRAFRLHTRLLRPISMTKRANLRFKRLNQRHLLRLIRAAMEVARICLLRARTNIRIMRQRDIYIILTMRPSVPRGRQVNGLQVALRRDKRIRSVPIIRHHLRASFVRAINGTIRILSNVAMDLRSVKALICPVQRLNNALRRRIMITICAHCRTTPRFQYIRHVRRRRLLTLYRENNQKGRRLGVALLVLRLERRHPPRDSIIVTFRVHRCTPTYSLKKRLTNNVRVNKDGIVS